jgi:hypothetical protein
LAAAPGPAGKKRSPDLTGESMSSKAHKWSIKAQETAKRNARAKMEAIEKEVAEQKAKERAEAREREEGSKGLVNTQSDIDQSKVIDAHMKSALAQSDTKQREEAFGNSCSSSEQPITRTDTGKNLSSPSLPTVADVTGALTGVKDALPASVLQSDPDGSDKTQTSSTGGNYKYNDAVTSSVIPDVARTAVWRTDECSSNSISGGGLHEDEGGCMVFSGERHDGGLVNNLSKGENKEANRNIIQEGDKDGDNGKSGESGGSKPAPDATTA